MTLILGVDPGSRVTGYGVIKKEGNQIRFVDCGCIYTNEKEAIPVRLQQIYQGIVAVIREYRPEQASIEQVFMANNADSALKLGQARGSAVVACMNESVEVHEYSARQAKLAVVGTGAAEKAQVQHMIKRILNLPEEPSTDAADALGLAICHANTYSTLSRVMNTRTVRRGRAQRWQEVP
ncbi:Holliday junction resolvasome endonuclease subunit [gamma proteobacterium HdN1]|nr:Holliday junction resolvasome endonuclease subunit [gamma proteobacterium HdN1]